jgi:hypothetical protein
MWQYSHASMGWNPSMSNDDHELATHRFCAELGVRRWIPVGLVLVIILIGGCTSTTTTTIPPNTIPAETLSNELVTFSGFGLCSLRPDPEVLGGGYDVTAYGTVTVHPPATGAQVEMDIVDSSGNVLPDGLGRPTPLQSHVFSGQPVNLETVISEKDRASACLVHWVVPKAS